MRKIKKFPNKAVISVLICLSMLFSCFGGYLSAQELQPTITAISANLNPNLSVYEGDMASFYEYNPENNTSPQVYGYDFIQLQVISSYDVTYSNGNVRNCQQYELNMEGYNIELTANQAEQPLEVGKPRTVQVFLRKRENNSTVAQTSFEITLKQNPIKFISCRATKELMEGTTEERRQHNPENPSQPIIYRAYNINNFMPLFTVTDQNNQTNEYYAHQLYQVFGVFPLYIEAEPQTATNIWSVGKHSVTAKVLGHTCNFEVSIYSNPIKSISCEATVELIEGETQTMQYHNPTNPSMNTTYQAYNISHFEPLFTVTYTDDTTETLLSYELQQKFGVDPTFNSDQSPTNLWGAGKHTATTTVLGHTCDIEVNIIKSPIKDLEVVYHGKVLKGTYFGGDDNGLVGNNMDSTLQPKYIEFILTFENGVKESYYGLDTMVVSDKYYAYPLNQKAQIRAIDLKNDGTWDEGKHQFSVKLFNIETTLTVDVIDPKIKEISAKATRFIVPEWHAAGGEDYKFLYPEVTLPDITITYEDGTTEVLSYNEAGYKFKGNEPVLFLENDSVEGVGFRTAKLYMFGKECEFQVEVKENPVESIVGKTTKPVYKDARGFISLAYDAGLEITVNFKDGTSFTGDTYEVNEYFNDWPTELDMDAKPTLNAVNIMPVSFLGKEFDVEYYYAENPLKIVDIDAKVVDGAKLYKNTNDLVIKPYNYDHLIMVTLYLSDGSTYTDLLPNIRDYIYETYAYTVYCSDDQHKQSFMNPWEKGVHTVEVNFDTPSHHISNELEIEVVDNPYVSAKLSGTDSLKIELTKKDGTTEILNARRFVGDTYFNTMGILYTDKGAFSVTFKHAGGPDPDYTDIYSLEIAGVLSEGIKGNTWLETQLKLRTDDDVPEISISNSANELRDIVTTDSDYQKMQRGNTTGMNAYISAENITEKLSQEENEILKEAQKDNNLDIIDGTVIDLSLYKSFNEEKSKVTEIDEKVRITITIPEEHRGKDKYSIIHIHNGVSTILEDIDSNPNTITFETDKFSTFAIAGESTSSLKGDVNSDGVVNSEDLTELRKILLKGSNNGDVNNDGKTNICDLVYLNDLI